MPISPADTVKAAVAALPLRNQALGADFLASPQQGNYHEGCPDLPVLPVFGSRYTQAGATYSLPGTDSFVVEY